MAASSCDAIRMTPRRRLNIRFRQRSTEQSAKAFKLSCDDHRQVRVERCTPTASAQDLRIIVRNLVTKARHAVGCGGYGSHTIRMYGDFAGRIGVEHTDAQPAWIGTDLGSIARTVTTDNVQQCRHVAHTAREQTFAKHA